MIFTVHFRHGHLNRALSRVVPNDATNLRVTVEDCVGSDSFPASLEQGVLFRMKAYTFDGTGHRREGTIAVGATSFVAIYETSRRAVVPKREQ